MRVFLERGEARGIPDIVEGGANWVAGVQSDVRGRLFRAAAMRRGATRLWLDRAKDAALLGEIDLAQLGGAIECYPKKCDQQGGDDAGKIQSQAQAPPALGISLIENLPRH